MSRLRPHKLLSKDIAAMTATCGRCGDIKLVNSSKGVICENAIRGYNSRKYGYPNDDFTYNRLKQDQQGRCAICQRKTKLVQDHDHTTHEIRGLLCDQCNLNLAWVERVGLSPIARYLKLV